MSSAVHPAMSAQRRRLEALARGECAALYGACAIVRVSGESEESRLHDALPRVSRGFAASLVGDDTPHAWPPVRVDAVEAPTHGSVEPGSWLLGELEKRARDASCDPVILLCRVAERQFLLGLRAPASMADARTMVLLAQRTAREHASGTHTASADRATLTYAAYAEWQQELVAGPAAADARAYWSRQPFPDRVRSRLPVARDVDEPDEFVPRRTTRAMPVSLLRRAEELAADGGVDLEAVLLAAWHTLLRRQLEAGTAVPVGVLLSGRGHELLQDVLGPCARYVPVYLEIGRGDTLPELAARAAATRAEHEIWQDCFDWALLDGESPREPAPYHAFGFDWIDCTDASWAGAGQTTFELDHVRATIDRFDIRLSCTRYAGRAECSIEWNDALYESSDMRRLAERYESLLASAVRTPDRRTAELAIVGDEERAWLLSCGAGEDAPAPPERCVHAAFEAQVQEAPARVAVVAGDETLTFGDIDRRAGALAVRLRAAGVTPGSRVAIALPRSADQIVALVGVLKAGAAFVPLDAATPAERLAWMLADAGASVLVTNAGTAVRAAEECRIAAIDPAAAPDADGPRVTTHVSPDHPAYVVYTSGSTGRPKGVVVSHRQLAHASDARARYYRQPVGTYLMVSPAAFDSSIAGIAWTLCYGGTLVLPREGEHADPAALRRLIHRHQVTHVLALPSLYAWVLDEEALGLLASLRTVIVAGEILPPALTARHGRLLSGVELHNEYGATECAIWSTGYRAGTADEHARVPVGRAIARTSVYVAERPWQLSPWRAAGEGLLAGDGVADGYLDRPDLTAARFVPDPWSGRPGARLYRTGDRLRWRADGLLDYLGRLDNQVKIRGHRIELEEIEAGIGAHPLVRECAVVVGEGAAASQHLVAFVVTDPSAPADPALFEQTIRRFLSERLPAAMVPASIVRLEALPKTTNGKLDRARLAALPRAPRPGVSAADEPRDATEREVAAIWRELLQIEAVGRNDNFFEVGGHSLAAIAVHGRLTAALAPQLRLVDLFRYPTISALASCIEAQRAPELEPVPAPDPAVVPDTRRRQHQLRTRRLAAQRAGREHD